MPNRRIRKLFVNPVKVKVKKDFIPVPFTESILRRI